MSGKRKYPPEYYTPEAIKTRRADQQRARYAANPERIRSVQYAWVAVNRDKVNESARKYRVAHPERLKERNRLAAAERRATNTPEEELARKESLRRSTYKKRYGITVVEYERLLLVQNGNCAVCEEQETRVHHITGKPQRLAVDHDHVTGEVRGLVCHRCNVTLARVGDSLDGVMRFVNYLTRS